MKVRFPGQRHGGASDISDLRFRGSTGDQVGVSGAARLNSDSELWKKEEKMTQRV